MNMNQITVNEFTTPGPVSVRPEEKLPNIWNIMQENGIRHILVTEGSKVLGILSERDITTFSQADYFKNVEARDIMSSDLVTVSPDTQLFEVALVMSENKVGSAVVIDENEKFIGIFTATDALNALVEVLRGDLVN